MNDEHDVLLVCADATTGWRAATNELAGSLERSGARVRTATNRSGGVQGGITNGEDIVFRVAFKPVATIAPW